MARWIVSPSTFLTKLVLPLFVLNSAVQQRSAIAQPPVISPIETRVLGQRSWLSGGPAALRLMVSNHETGLPLKADVKISLKAVQPAAKTTTITLFRGSTNRVGSVDAGFRLPHLPVGNYEFSVDVHTSLGDDTTKQQVTLQSASRLMLSVDKPLYQPGQTIHIRTLVLDAATLHAVAASPVTIEVEDARGNKVYKAKQTLSEFGTAGADFVLADEVNMGTFTVRAVLDGANTEKKVQVSRYVLPKFKVAVHTDKPYYLPGERVKGSIQADYFFGKAVSGGAVTVALSTVNIGVEKLSEITGKTDASGKYEFDFTLPQAMFGQPFEQGKAIAEVAADVRDLADHKQHASLSIPVVRQPIVMTIVPEHRGLVAGVNNRIYIAASTADGQPLKSKPIRVTRTDPDGTVAHSIVTADDLGLAAMDFKAQGAVTVLKVEADDGNGHTGEATVNLDAANATQALILRAERSIVKVGENLKLTVLAPASGGTLYLDVIHNRQTILTYSQQISGQTAEHLLPITDDMTGTIEVRAYRITADEQIVRDSRTIIVEPASDLRLKIVADKSTYRPGGDAAIHFHVTDSQNHPVAAAIGVAIVDESVFALSELQPGLERIYFLLEKELMEPKYEIHGLRPTFFMQHDNNGYGTGVMQRAAAVVLSAAEPKWDYDMQANTYMARWAEVRTRVVSQMQSLHRTLVNTLQKYRADTGTMLLASESLTLLAQRGYISEAQLVDPWGRFYKADLYGAANYGAYFTLSCSGPDGKWGSADDIIGVSMYGWNGNALGGGAMRGRGFGGRGGPGGVDGAFLADGIVMDQALGVVKREMAVAGMRAPVAMAMAKGASTVTREDVVTATASEPATRVRDYFPETMYWNPALITDEHGATEIHVPVADSITTWRISATANSVSGMLGSTTGQLKVFQDFFVDIDLPVSLTQDDTVDVPVAVYNYMTIPQDVVVTLEQDAWFTLSGSNTQKLHLDAGQVTSTHFSIVAKSIGRHSFTVTAHGSKLSDAMRRQIDVTPDGKERPIALNNTVTSSTQETFQLPASAIQGASSLYLKVYPGAFSQVIEGLDGILRMPNGCFEQTSSSTYPNVLTLDYLRANHKINPEIQMKAEQYINIGYQRLVTFECKSGGFSWFGNEPAHQVLTAYGLLEFSDMSKVHEVDPAVIQRTQNWLASKQQAGGSWNESGPGIAEGIINRQTGALRTTAYIGWALAESGYHGPALSHAVSYVKDHWTEAHDPYTLAVILNMLAKVELESDSTNKVAERLIEMAKSDEQTAWWPTDSPTFTGAANKGADLETSGLAAYALLKWGRNAGFTNRALAYLVKSKDSFGTWQSTQGTVWALKSLLFASKGGGSGTAGTLTVSLNGSNATSIKITPEDSDVMKQVALTPFLKPGNNQVSLKYSGNGSLLYQVSGRYYTPWTEEARPIGRLEPLSIAVVYDKRSLVQDDIAHVAVTVHNNTERIAEMPLIDIGIPPGFDVIPDQLAALVKAGKISKYTVAGRQLIVYIEKLGPTETLTINYEVRAKYPVKAKTPSSKIYLYYSPDKSATSAPQDIAVTK